jgi:ADP-ribose pyrophosphatase
MNPSSSGPARWENLGERTLATTRIFELRSRHYRHPVRGTERDFVVIDAPDWANVIALTPQGHLVLVNQFRYGTDAFSLEIPGGVIERGEDPLVAGVRELREETGFEGRPARLLGTVRPNPAILNNHCHFILVEAAVPTAHSAWDHDEEIAVSTAPVEEVFAWARSGQITHALVLNALWFFEPVWAEMKARDV